MEKEDYIAHIKLDPETGEWSAPHGLAEHLLATAAIAKEFAHMLGREWAELAGRWHDLGKYRQHFQGYIRVRTGFEAENAHIEDGIRKPHSTAGAIHAINQLPAGLGHIIAYLIAGHHAGLPDFFGGRGSLQQRLIDGQTEYRQAMEEKVPDAVLHGECKPPPDFARQQDRIALWIRMLFSCLVDADFLDTEHYMQPEKFARRKSTITIEQLLETFERNIAALQKGSEKNDLNNIRNSIYEACCTAAQWQPGLFSLTVPTGGGKTLSSLAFALKHAKQHEKRRIVYAIPFTSIIEQNADVFRRFLGKYAVLEHHSNLDVEPGKENLRNRLASENWDAPLIVTTNVQLFESLHASRTSRCRKLHNLINSVIILDEAQQLPRDFHEPITRTMQQLSDFYGVTWVLCTATQPELGKSTDSFGQVMLQGLKNVREIVPDPGQLARQLRRVDITMPDLQEPRTSWDELSTKLLGHDCALAIVNTRKQARRLAELIGEDDCLHLSANMCAEHRSQVLAEINERLDKRRQGETRPLRVISTQLIEAGVDVDFPVVYRAIAGLDSIAQSAGRCNREGRLCENGQVYVFRPEESSPVGFLRQGEDSMIELLGSGELFDPLSPAAFKQYFQLVNSKGERDKHGVVKLLTPPNPTANAPLAIQFRKAAEKFRLIDESGESVVVPFIPAGHDQSPVEKWLDLLEKDGSQKWIYRKLQRFMISLSKGQFKKFRENGYIDQRAGLSVLLESFYHQRWGADCSEPVLPAEDCVL